VHWVESFAAFLSLEHEWERLVRDGPSPFLTHRWLRSWWEVFGRDTPRVCTVRCGDTLVAALPLVASRSAYEGWSNSETDEFRPLAETRADLNTLVSAVMAAGWSRLTIRGLPEADEAGDALLGAARQHSLALWSPLDDAPIIETGGSLSDYRARMSANTRRRVRKLRRKLERQHVVQLTTLEQPADPLSMLDEALGLEAAGWKGRAAAPCSTPRYELLLPPYRARVQQRIEFQGLRAQGRLAARGLRHRLAAQPPRLLPADELRREPRPVFTRAHPVHGDRRGVLSARNRSQRPLGQAPRLEDEVRHHGPPHAHATVLPTAADTRDQIRAQAGRSSLRAAWVRRYP
jgi:hypothetical protein